MFTYKEVSQSLTIRKLNSGEEVEVCNLVVRSFNEFIAAGFSVEGVQHFYGYASYRALVKRIESGFVVMVAEVNGNIAGVVEINKYKHLSMLYVDKRHHRRGIARELVKKAIEKIREHKPKLKKITVNSSQYAIEFYKKIGFRERAPERIINGMPHTPMVLPL